MFGRRPAIDADDGYVQGRTTQTITVTDRAPYARGGLSLGAILTGVVVAFGAMFILGALIAGVLTSLGLLADGMEGEAVEAGVAAGLALVVAQFLAYMWGGYTAGRMGRGAGALNGAMVPFSALVVAAIVAAIATALGATANLNLPFTANRLPVEGDFLVDFGLMIGIASLVAMFIGGILGGALGARWHTRLERAVYERDVEERREVDLRDADVPATSATAAPAAAGDTTVRRPAPGETPISSGPRFTTDKRT